MNSNTDVFASLFSDCIFPLGLSHAPFLEKAGLFCTGKGYHSINNCGSPAMVSWWMMVFHLVKKLVSRAGILAAKSSPVQDYFRVSRSYLDHLNCVSYAAPLSLALLHVSLGKIQLHSNLLMTPELAGDTNTEKDRAKLPNGLATSQL